MNPDTLRNAGNPAFNEGWTEMPDELLSACADAWEADIKRACDALREATRIVDELNKRLEAAADTAYDEMFSRNVDRDTMNAVRAKIAALAAGEPLHDTGNVQGARPDEVWVDDKPVMITVAAQARGEKRP